jgi:hypothetical protein
MLWFQTEKGGKQLVLFEAAKRFANRLPLPPLKKGISGAGNENGSMGHAVSFQRTMFFNQCFWSPARMNNGTRNSTGAMPSSLQKQLSSA